MNVFKCDVCGKETYIEPWKEPAYNEVIKVIDGKKQTVKERKLSKMLIQNPITGVVEEKIIPAFNDLNERCYIVSLKMGSERVQRDFCLRCLNKYKKEFKKVFMLLANLDSQ